MEEYNGWPNFPTWVVNLEVVDDVTEGWRQDGERFATYGDLATALREWCDGMLDEAYLMEKDGGYLVPTSLYEWMRRNVERFLFYVDWYVIAKAYDDLIETEGGSGDE